MTSRFQSAGTGTGPPTTCRDAFCPLQIWGPERPRRRGSTPRCAGFCALHRPRTIALKEMMAAAAGTGSPTFSMSVKDWPLLAPAVVGGCLGRFGYKRSFIPPDRPDQIKPAPLNCENRFTQPGKALKLKSAACVKWTVP